MIISTQLTAYFEDYISLHFSNLNITDGEVFDLKSTKNSDTEIMTKKSYKKKKSNLCLPTEANFSVTAR